MATDQLITSIDPAKRDPLKRVIKVGKRKVATLDVEQIAELGLRVGDAWDDGLAGRVAEVIGSGKVRRDALKIIERRAVTTGDLVDRLTRKGHDESAAESVVADLASKGLVDDEQFARSMVASQRASKPAGARLLRAKLYQKKVPRDVAERVLEEADADYDAVNEARRLAEKKLASASMQRAEGPTRYRRLYGLLARRGFNPDTIREALGGLEGLRGDGEARF